MQEVRDIPEKRKIRCASCGLNYIQTENSYLINGNYCGNCTAIASLRADMNATESGLTKLYRLLSKEKNIEKGSKLIDKIWRGEKRVETLKARIGYYELCQAKRKSIRKRGRPMADKRYGRLLQKNTLTESRKNEKM